MHFNPTTDKGNVILCSSNINNVDNTTADLYKKYNVSSLVWNLPTQ